MWILFVINVVTVEPGESAIKYTRYDEFETEMSCHIERAVLEAYNQIFPASNRQLSITISFVNVLLIFNETPTAFVLNGI